MDRGPFPGSHPLVETARGCPFRCSFCSIWQLYDRSFRERSIGHVVRDVEQTGDHVFFADDLFWHRPARSAELARALKKRGVHKKWLLVQTRTDLVARGADLLEEWRPVAERIDIFFGLEAPSNAGLDAYTKDADVNATAEAVRVARALDYGVTGNFMIDPAWGEADFRVLWDFVREHGLHRAGYTILTPLPGTKDWERWKDTVRGQPWYKWDMHHLLWQPRLGVERFFALFAETWRRSVLNVKDATAGRRMVRWLRQIRATQIPQLVRLLLRTQRIMDAGAYVREQRASERVCALRPAARSGGDEAHVVQAHDEVGQTRRYAEG